MKPLRYPSVAQVFEGNAREAEAAIATNVEDRTPEQTAMAKAYTDALVQSVARRLRSPDAEPRRPSNAWLQQGA
jgi:hypothetical protein